MDEISAAEKTIRGKKFPSFVSALLTILLIVVICTLPFVFTIEVWDGRFPLTLKISPSSGENVKEVSYCSFNDLQAAKRVESPTYHQVEKGDFFPVKKEKDHFVVSIPCSGKLWIFNIETAYSEPRYIVLLIQFENGKKLRRMEEIPKGRGPRTLSVVVP